MKIICSCGREVFDNGRDDRSVSGTICGVCLTTIRNIKTICKMGDWYKDNGEQNLSEHLYSTANFLKAVLTAREMKHQREVNGKEVKENENA